MVWGRLVRSFPDGPNFLLIQDNSNVSLRVLCALGKFMSGPSWGKSASFLRGSWTSILYKILTCVC